MYKCLRGSAGVPQEAVIGCARQAVCDCIDGAAAHGVDVKTNAVMQAVRQACKRDDFRPRTSALCNYCTFQEFCPEFDGQPELARPTLLARQAEREGRPQLPLVFA